MRCLVNGQLVPEELIRQEYIRIGRDPRWNEIADSAERARQQRLAAEQSAQDVILIQQRAAADPRPIEDSAIDAEVARQTAQWGCRSAFDVAELRRLCERNLRVERIKQEMVAGAVIPTVEEMEAFFQQNRQQFPRPEMFHASHIVKKVTPAQSVELAEAGIMLAEEELEHGNPFAEVADRWTDCADKGGDIGWFPVGAMVKDFDEVISELEPGQRSAIFTTEFGFHIAVLHEKKPAGLADFEDARPTIERVMTYAAHCDAYTRAIAEMRAHADIRWVDDPPPAGT